ncbi:hypothetical protein DLAC_01731 [Tieghemostelium lacteum]|uniref:FNIP repeat-containing protein n=1 Tax=Tieghemostelium lacteum TaxID=361077 RepID=A0A152A6H0_TIELA|nr:hypothetical protein DLAC_01731 [Tieghemostelium lacteum]|eukprot:KYR01721.1 hypothetical protein DLAC_01731 [Tieghemostelium lacteum]
MTFMDYPLDFFYKKKKQYRMFKYNYNTLPKKFKTLTINDNQQTHYKEMNPLNSIEVEHMTINYSTRNSLYILPLNLTTLVLGQYFLYKFSPGQIPATVTKLVSECKSKIYNLDYTLPQILPPSLTDLSMYFTEPLKVGDLVEPLVSLKLLKDYRHSIQVGVLPKTLKNLTCLDSPQFEIGALHNGLESLTLGYTYDHLLDSRIPPSLTNLSLPIVWVRWSPEFCGLLPKGLKSLKMDIQKLVPIQMQIESLLLPSTLTSLILRNFDSPIVPGMFPDTIETLELHGFNYPLSEGMLPQSITTLHLLNYNHPLKPGHLPGNLKKLIFGFFNSVIEPKSLPTTLEYLMNYSTSFNHSIPTNELPNLNYLHMESLKFKSAFISNLPPKLKTAYFGSLSITSIGPITLNNGIVTLILRNGNINIKQKNLFPISLLHLTLPSDFNNIIEEGDLPPNLQTLEFGNHFQSLIKHLPQSLKILKLHKNYAYQQKFSYTLLPPYLRQLHIHDYNPLSKCIIPKYCKITVNKDT